jgi:PGF-pre-PGF domain-containing protein
VTVATTDNVGVTEVKANEVSLANESGNWTGIITALEGIHFVNVSSEDEESNVVWNNSTSYTASTPSEPVVAPIASFTANETSGTAPLDVQFTDTSTNTPTSWEWQFGDGTENSTEQNPIHRFTSAGTYTVNVTATNAGGSNVAGSETITVNAESEPLLPVADFETNVSSGYAPLSVRFTDCSIYATEVNWDFNNDGVIDSTSLTPVYTFTSAGTYTVSLTAINEDRRASKTATINVYEKSSSGGSSSSSGGSGGSPEPATNVQVKELAQTFVTNGKNVKFDFAKEATCVMYVSFDAKKTVGKTTSSIEMLKGKSTLVSELPSGEIYKSFNVWVGSSGFATQNNIENSVICFKVEKSWIKDKKIIPTTIDLYRYNDKKWNKLETSLLNDDDKYLYFTAKTPGFSPFIIKGESTVKAGNGNLSNNDTQQAGENNTTLQVEQKTPTEKSTENKGNKRTPGFETVYGIACLCVLFLYRRIRTN